MQASLASKSSTPMGAAARNLYSLHKNSDGQDKGALDFSSILQLYAK
jgi:3-hydroxyisobutyrate dehydrogenase